MTKVYIVILYVQHEPSDCLGVCSSLELAQKLAKQYVDVNSYQDWKDSLVYSKGFQWSGRNADLTIAPHFLDSALRNK